MNLEIRNLTSNITECNHTVYSPRPCNASAKCVGTDEEVETETCIYAKKCTREYVFALLN